MSCSVNLSIQVRYSSTAFGTTTDWNSLTFLIKFTWQGKSGSRGNNTGIFFGSDDWQDDSPPTSGKRIGMRMVNFDSQRVGLHIGGSSVTEQAFTPTHYGDMTSGGLGSDNTKHYLIEGNGTNVVCSYYSSTSDRDAKNNAIATSSAVTFPSGWLDKDPINHISLGEWSGYYKGHTIISDISIKVDDGNLDYWTQKGTA